MKRLLLYVHYNKYNELSGHVLYQLEQLRPFFSKLVVISNSHLTAMSIESLNKLGIKDIIQRDNRGYDFAAWGDGMDYIGFSQLSDFDTLTLMNDTCFGPLWDLGETFTLFNEKSDIDFWGMTNFRKTKYFVEHLQSYFMTFKQQVIQSEVFQTFWSSIKDFTDVQDVIDHYETQVTSVLLEAGFRYDAVFNTLSEKADGLIHPDFSYYRPFSILDHKVPFIKVKTFKDNEKMSALLLSYISEKSDFPIEVIKQYINRYLSPDSLAILEDKIFLPLYDQKVIKDYDLAVHIHVTDISKLQVILDKQIKASYFITLSESVDATLLEKMLQDSCKQAFQLILDPFASHFQALFSLRNQLASFDYIGHFHTDRLNETSQWLDDKCRQKLLSVLLDDKVLQRVFDSTTELGLLFADLPEEGALTTTLKPLRDDEEGVIRSLCKKVYSSHPLSITGGYLWFSHQFLEEVLAENSEQLNQIDDNFLDYILYLKAWDKDLDYRIIPLDDAFNVIHRKLALVELSETKLPQSFLARFKIFIYAVVKKLVKKK